MDLLEVAIYYIERVFDGVLELCECYWRGIGILQFKNQSVGFKYFDNVLKTLRS